MSNLNVISDEIRAIKEINGSFSKFGECANLKFGEYDETLKVFSNNMTGCLSNLQSSFDQVKAPLFTVSVRLILWYWQRMQVHYIKLGIRHL